MPSRPISLPLARVEFLDLRLVCSDLKKKLKKKYVGFIKFVVALSVTNDYPGGFWEDYGYNWFNGS